jgi:dephospho-CoA kinase
MQKIIFGLVGDLAAGKGTVAKYLKDKYNVNTYRFSTMLRDILHRIHIKETRESMQKLSTFIRENFGQDVMSEVISKDVENDANNLVIVDGIRRPSDIVYLKNNPGFNLVYITANPKIRWERLVKRNENKGDSEKTFEQFLADEKAEAEMLIKQVGAESDYTINNDGDVDELHKNIEKILEKIKNK